MRLRSARTAVVLALAVVLSLVLGANALAAPPWSDAPNTWWFANYKVTDAQVGAVADGFDDGTFRPGLAVTRGQFAKMATSGLGVPRLDPATPTFVDVPKGSTFFRYVEAASAEGLIGGYETTSGRLYKPDATISRQQANSILGRYLSQVEQEATGVIHGVGIKTYASLQEWYMWEGAFYVEGFLDKAKVVSDHLAATAYLVFRNVVQGSDGYLQPTATLNRAQAATLVLRVSEAAAALTAKPLAPTLLSTTPQNPGPTNWCNDPTPLIQGTALPFGEVHVYDSGGTAWIAAGYADSTGHVSLRVQTPLGEGTHLLTAKVRNSSGLVSPESNTLIYALDTRKPAAAISSPAPAEILYTEDHRFAFSAAASDDPKTAGGEASGVARVDFLWAPWSVQLLSGWDAFRTISSSVGSPYEAMYQDSGLGNGHYVLAVRVTDKAGNENALTDGSGYAAGVTQEVIVDDAPPVVTISAPVAGDLVPDNSSLTVRWTLTDVAPPDTVTIEYSPGFGANWLTVADAAPNTGSYSWHTPAVAEEAQGYEIRITAVDKVGAYVGDIAGHTTVVTAGPFAVYPGPLAAASIVASDTDLEQPGVTGLDFHANWVVSESLHIVSQSVFVLPADQAPNLAVSPVDVPVSVIADAAADSWTGSPGLVMDSRGKPLAEGEYRVWIVVSDAAGRTAVAASGVFGVSSETGTG